MSLTSPMTPTPQPRLSPHIRQSTDADMEAIHTWLQEQQRAGVHGTFLCNWRLTRESHDEGKLQVYVDPESQTPVAYQWGGLLRPGILEVRHDLRGRGIGKEFVEHCLAQAAQAGEYILCIQCKPSTSIAFWRGMGFQLDDEGGRESYATRMARESLELPKDGDPVQVTLEWFPERRKWEASTLPVLAQAIEGRLLGGEVWLSERALCPGRIEDGDAVLRVTVDGQEWYCDKAKYERAEELGVERCSNGYFIEVLNVLKAEQ